MHLSVAICTWNRCELLGRALESFTKIAAPEGFTWELLVVNNNCTDGTDEVIGSFTGRLPIRRLFEPKPGHSNARNLAIAESTGSYILWTDDDTLVDPNWIASYHEAALRWPGAAVFGGPIEPWFPKPPPPWLTAAWAKVSHAYAAVDHGPEPLPLNPERVVFGANLVVRTDWQRTNLFDPGRGLRPGSHLRGDERDVVNRILYGGGTGWWVPRARVRHYVPTDRQTIGYLRAYFGGWGEALARFHPDPDSPRLFGHPRWVWKAIIVNELRFRVRRLFAPPEVWVDDLMATSTARGRLRAKIPLE
jgi:glycosyltransferase involved in cell wall biosynthesis